MHCTDCGTTYNLTHGQVTITDGQARFNQSVPVDCDEGYEIHGEHYITCLADGTWSKNTTCVIKGKLENVCNVQDT